MRYRQDDGFEVTPSTMLGYIASLNRSLKLKDYPTRLFEDELFFDKQFGLIPVLDNRCAEKQANGAIVMHENTLPREELIKILDCDPRTSLGYVYLYIIIKGYMFTERIGAATGGGQKRRRAESNFSCACSNTIT